MIGLFVALCALVFRKRERKQKALINSPPTSPEEQLCKMKIQEEKLRKMQSEPSNIDSEVSKQFATNFHLTGAILF